MSFDLFLFHLLNNWSRTYWLLDWAMIFFAQYAAYLMVIAAAFFFLLLGSEWKKQAYYFAVVSLSLLLSSGIITAAIRYFYHRARPFAALNLVPLFIKDEWSFPSGHASFFFALSFAVLFFNKKLGWWLWGLSVLMGIARVYAGVHYPSDILGGAAIGMLSVLFVVWILEPKKFRERIKKMAF